MSEPRLIRRFVMLLFIVLLLPLQGCGGGDGEGGLAGLGDAESIWPSTEAYVAHRQELRLFEGAPPVVPHPIEGYGREDCLACHLHGEAIDEESGRPAPVTPHPEQANCRQCHVARQTNEVFRANLVQGLEPWTVEAPANPLGPPYIPHRLQDRENCRACHLGEAAANVIVPGHGERANCRQCHIQLLRAAAPFPPETTQGGNHAGT